MKEIKINDFLGEKIRHEDTVILREFIEENIENGIVIDFENRRNIPITVFSSILVQIMCEKGCKYVNRQLVVKNLPNLKEFKRVLNGTSCNI